MDTLGRVLWRFCSAPDRGIYLPHRTLYDAYNPFRICHHARNPLVDLRHTFLAGPNLSTTDLWSSHPGSRLLGDAEA